MPVAGTEMGQETTSPAQAFQEILEQAERHMGSQRLLSLNLFPLTAHSSSTRPLHIEDVPPEDLPA